VPSRPRIRRALLPFVAYLCCLAPLEAAADTVTVKGSDTMVILAQRWIELYVGENPGAVVQLTGGGSETGIAALTNGTTDVAAASRPMAPGEVARAEARHGRRIVQIPVAVDALAVVVHPSNPLDALSLDELGRIFLGERTSWHEVGGPAVPIAIYGRDHNSGSWGFFRRVVLGDQDFSLDMLSLVGTASVFDSVAKDPHGIGFGGIAYATAGAKKLRLRRAPDAPAIEATVGNARNGSYPLARTLYFHVAEPLDADTQRFVDWVLGERGQRVVREVGYFPLRG
jgi:phosphate transport system substrate-binding protein